MGLSSLYMPRAWARGGGGGWGKGRGSVQRAVRRGVGGVTGAQERERPVTATAGAAATAGASAARGAAAGRGRGTAPHQQRRRRDRRRHEPVAADEEQRVLEHLAGGPAAEGQRHNALLGAGARGAGGFGSQIAPRVAGAAPPAAAHLQDAVHKEAAHDSGHAEGQAQRLGRGGQHPGGGLRQRRPGALVLELVGARAGAGPHRSRVNGGWQRPLPLCGTAVAHGAPPARPHRFRAHSARGAHRVPPRFPSRTRGAQSTPPPPPRPRPSVSAPVLPPCAQSTLDTSHDAARGAGAPGAPDAGAAAGAVAAAEKAPGGRRQAEEAAGPAGEGAGAGQKRSGAFSVAPPPPPPHLAPHARF
jgi:hypothetical protein